MFFVSIHNAHPVKRGLIITVEKGPQINHTNAKFIHLYDNFRKQLVMQLAFGKLKKSRLVDKEKSNALKNARV